MQIEKLQIKKLANLPLDDAIEKTDSNALYCEIEYKRDKSSYAGMAFKLTGQKNVCIARRCKEKIIQEVSVHEKILRGCEKDYIDSIKEIYSSEEREYGIEILFLVYSDVRSSQIVFEELMNNINEHLKDIEKYMNFR